MLFRHSYTTSKNTDINQKVDIGGLDMISNDFFYSQSHSIGMYISVMLESIKFFGGSVMYISKGKESRGVC